MEDVQLEAVRTSREWGQPPASRAVDTRAALRSQLRLEKRWRVLEARKRSARGALQVETDSAAARVLQAERAGESHS